MQRRIGGGLQLQLNVPIEAAIASVERVAAARVPTPMVFGPLGIRADTIPAGHGGTTESAWIPGLGFLLPLKAIEKRRCSSLIDIYSRCNRTSLNVIGHAYAHAAKASPSRHRLLGVGVGERAGSAQQSAVACTGRCVSLSLGIHLLLQPLRGGVMDLGRQLVGSRNLFCAKNGLLVLQKHQVLQLGVAVGCRRRRRPRLTR